MPQQKRLKGKDKDLEKNERGEYKRNRAVIKGQEEETEKEKKKKKH